MYVALYFLTTSSTSRQPAVKFSTELDIRIGSNKVDDVDIRVGSCMMLIKPLSVIFCLGFVLLSDNKFQIRFLNTIIL